MRDVYVSIAKIDNCRICGERQDLRCGTCFECSDQVAGEQISEVTHKMWDINNPSNVWYYSKNHN